MLVEEIVGVDIFECVVFFVDVEVELILLVDDDFKFYSGVLVV